MIEQAMKWIAEHQWKPTVVVDPGRPDMRIIADRQGNLSSFLATEERVVRLAEIDASLWWIEDAAQRGLNIRGYVSSQAMQLIGELRAGAPDAECEDVLVPAGSLILRETALIEIAWSMALRELLLLRVAPGGQAARMSPSVFVDFLSRRLCRGVAREEIAPFRRIDCTRLQKVKSVSERGNESLGRAIESQVQGVETLPESVTATIPLLAETDSLVMSFRIRVDIDAEGGTLIPSVNEAEISAAMTAIRTRACGVIDYALPDIKSRTGRDDLEVPVLHGELEFISNMGAMSATVARKA